MPERTDLLYRKGEPGQPVPVVHVAAEVATDLMFPSEVDPTLTKLIGGEGRFEPLMISGRSVVVVPLHDLTPGESFSLIATLKDGTSVPFNLRAPGPQDSTDGQVDVHLNQDDPAALRRALAQARERVEVLSAENERREREETSVNHAIATLLARGHSKLTPFVESSESGKVIQGISTDIKVVTFRPRKAGGGLGKVALVFQIINKAPKAPWMLDDLRLFSATSGDVQPFAFRAAARVVQPGKTETMAVVMDAQVFGPDRNDHIDLEIWQRLASGYPARQAIIELVMIDDKALPVSVSGGRGQAR